MNAFACAFQNGRTPGTPARMGVFACSRAATFSRAQSTSPCERSRGMMPKFQLLPANTDTAAIAITTAQIFSFIFSLPCETGGSFS